MAYFDALPAKPFAFYIAKTYEGTSTVGRKKFIAVRIVPAVPMRQNAFAFHHSTFLLYEWDEGEVRQGFLRNVRRYGQLD